ncbi:DUF421 domain-containing protein [Jeotgalibacillus sp. S-D1]|uniref:DUF421 domain-containing protein n=1 Tax=Jeotgalibacillus sp. S-D1 TaxID=2552189 RepID=UPI0010597B55|nr:DUF421 domain-containing protein [Jeotgalibacillus sp. S-D1]TDL31011.1 DUF421 domain-containing protein [Jeotgalibacillus sp. S-D1]
MSIGDLLIRIGLSFLVLLILTRLIGRQEISQLTFFNFVSGIAIGSIGANLAINSDVTLRNGIIGLISWGLITILLELLDIKFPKIRTALDGEPRILIKHGKIMEKQLKKTRIDIDSLLALLRNKGIFSIKEVDYAIFETNGNLSVLKKEINTQTNSTEKEIVPIFSTVVSDGKISEKNLQELDLSRQWLEQKLQEAGVRSLQDVFYAGIQKDGTIYVDFREDRVKEN